VQQSEHAVVRRTLRWPVRLLEEAYLGTLQRSRGVLRDSAASNRPQLKIFMFMLCNRVSRRPYQQWGPARPFTSH